MSVNNERCTTVIEAGALIRSGQCTAMCLLAQGDEATSCRCRCGGALHGRLTTVPIEGVPAVRDWTETVHEVLLHTPLRVAHTNVAAFNRVYRELRRQNIVRPILQKRGRTWLVLFDTDLEYPRQWPEVGGAAAREFCIALWKARRASTVFPPPGEYVAVIGLKTEQEARAVAAVLWASWTGDPGPAERATAALLGQSARWSA